MIHEHVDKALPTNDPQNVWVEEYMSTSTTPADIQLTQNK